MVRIDDRVLEQHRLTVPLDHDHPDRGTIELFAREVRAVEGGDTLPWLVFLQGGPGFGAPRPPRDSVWLENALRSYRVLLLDQRGTGLSHPLNYQTLAGHSPQEQARILSLFRADSIVRDAELFRTHLAGDQPWSLLGQSYGGFCALTYLSLAWEGLGEVMIAGGLPSLQATAQQVYQATFARMEDRNHDYYERYPEDEALWSAVVRTLVERDVRLPCGDRLSPRRLQQLGLAFGMTHGLEDVHHLLEQAFLPGGTELSYAFLTAVERAVPYLTHPVFAVLHESIYGQGGATGWAAEAARVTRPAFEAHPDQRFLFTGEMIFPWMFEEYGTLRPLAEAAEILAYREHWPALYDPAQLAANTVPVAAMIYRQDPYVERTFSEATANAIQGACYRLSDRNHDGLRMDGDAVFSELQSLLADSNVDLV